MSNPGELNSRGSNQYDGGLLASMASEVESLNHEKGWYDKARSFGEDVALLHSEVSEALEAFRDGVMHGYEWKDATGKVISINDNHAPLVHNSAAIRMYDEDFGPGKPIGVASELADVLVRLLDTASRYNVDIFEEWRKKMDFNWTRPRHHGGKKL